MKLISYVACLAVPFLGKYCHETKVFINFTSPFERFVAGKGSQCKYKVKTC